MISPKPHDGKGLGRSMMQRLLWETKKLSYQQASTGMRISNHRANLLYINTGFRVIDINYQVFKDFDQNLPSYPLMGCG